MGLTHRDFFQTQAMQNENKQQKGVLSK